MSDQANANPLWSLALSSVLPALAEQDLDAFCSSVLKDQRIRDRMRRELFYQPRHGLLELAETDVVELCQVSNEWRIDGSVGQDFNMKLVHLGALPFRIREAVRQLFREQDSTSHKTEHGKAAPDGRYQLWVEVDEDTDLSDCYEFLEDAYMRALDKFTFEECIPCPTDFDEVDITDQFHVQPDTALYDAYDLTFNDQDTQIREAFLEDCLAFFADDSAFRLPETVKPLTVSHRQVWVRKPRVRIVLGGCRRV